MKFKAFVFLAGLTFLSGCATYRQAKDVKIVAFDTDVKKGKSIGNIQGEDCIWTVMGYRLGGQPSLDRAFTNARMNRTSSALGDVMGSENTMGDGLRYINKVSTKNRGWNAVVVGKDCLTVTGIGYK